jgi:hypothetical protein
VTDQGVLDWLAQKWVELLAFFTGLYGRAEAQFDRAESHVLWLVVGAVVFLGLVHLAAAWLHARMVRKP